MKASTITRHLFAVVMTLAVAFALIAATSPANAASITSAASGNWSSTATWVGGVVPTAADVVTIGHVVTVDANATIAGLTITGTLQFTNAVTPYTLTFASGSTITVNGTLDMGPLGVLMTGTSGTTTLTMGAAGTLKTSNLTGLPAGALGPGAGSSLQEQGTGVFSLPNFETAGSVIYNGVGAGAYTVTDRNYNIVFFNTTTSTFTWTLAADRYVRGTGAAALNIGALKVTLAGGHNIILTAGGLNNNSGGAGVLDAGGNSIVFTGTGLQYISGNSPLGTTTFTNTNLIVNNGVGGSVNGNGGRPIIIDGSVTVTSGLFSTAGAITQINRSIVNNDRFTLGNALALGGNFTNNGTFTGGANIVTFNGSAAQVIGGTTPATFGGMTLTNTSAPVSATTGFNVSGTLAVNINASLIPGSDVIINSAGPAGTLTGSGTVQVTRISPTADF